MPGETASSSFPTSWRTVAFGTACLSAGAVVLALGTLAFSTLIAFNTQLAGEASVEGLGERARQLPALSVIGCLLVIMTGLMLWLAGLCITCLAPPESGARPLAWGATICWLLFLVAVLQVQLASIGIRVPEPRLGNKGHDPRDGQRVVYGSDGGFGLAAGMFAIAGGSLTMGFVCAVAHRFRNEKLARSARHFLVYQIIALPTMLMILVVNDLAGDAWFLRGYFGKAVIGVPLVGIPVVGCIWLLRFLTETRRMLRTAEEIASENPEITKEEKGHIE